MKLVIDYPIKYVSLPHGDVNFILAPLIEKNQRYKDGVNHLRYLQRETMFDNGAWEFGRSMDISDYIALARQYEPTYIVVPDVMKDSKGTFDSATDFLGTWDRNKTKVMIAPQGKNFEEVFTNFIDIMESWSNKIDMLAVPKHIGNWMNRMEFTNKLWELSPWKPLPVHFLGFHDFSEFKIPIKNDWVLHSVDTKHTLRDFLDIKFDSQMDYYNWRGMFDEEKFGRYTKAWKDMIVSKIGDIQYNTKLRQNNEDRY